MTTYSIPMTIVIEIDNADALKIAALEHLAGDADAGPAERLSAMESVLTDLSHAIAVLTYPEAALHGQPGCVVTTAVVGIPEPVQDE
ncbi:hypothetical protein ACQUSY_11600 [Microbacterium sp. YY-03]|uniref:hypothetical protein n=1 Tax=Microbacterium sp. YY-03 TaxID=3421636 RepID=UPI003D1646AF